MVQPLMSALRAAAAMMWPPCSGGAGRQVVSRTLWTREEIAEWAQFMCQISEVSVSLPVTAPCTCTEA